MPLPRRIAQPTSLRQMLGLEAEVGQVPSGEMFNRMIPESIEKQRESSILSDMDARTSASMQRDLAESEAVRSARNMGFQGSFPLREQEQYEAEQKLKQLLAPEKLKLEAATIDRQTAREFEAKQNQMDRENRLAAARLSQTGQTGRTNITQSSINARQAATQEAKRNWFDKLLGLNKPTAPSASGMEEMVIMLDPTTGQTRPVPADQVDKYLARGAQVVE